MKCGGTSQVRAATDETQQIVQGVKDQAEEKEGRTFQTFEAIEYKTQIVAGTIYYIKVHIGNEEYLHIRVLRSLPHENRPLTLMDHQSNKTKHDELSYF